MLESDGVTFTMQESSIKRLLESEVSRVTGLNPDDLKTQSKSIRYPKRVEIKSSEIDSEYDRSFSQVVLALRYFLFFFLPLLSKDIEDLRKFEDFNEPEVQLMLEVASYFIDNPDNGISDVLSTVDKEKASFIGL